jgi:uncharacterized protein YndB with AHSA1/START domain
MMVDAEDLTIRKTVHVEVPVDSAFDSFTAGWHDWWPMETHSIANGEGVIDWRVGGTASELVEGKRVDWADIVEYDPPHGFTMRWRVSAGQPATELRLRFEPDGSGTRVELTHAGWETYPDGGEEASSSYTSGWDIVLGHYTRHVNG